MSHFAQLDNNNMVVNVIVAEQELIISGSLGSPTGWVQIEFNGVYIEGPPGIGYTYDSALDAFYAPQPYPSWVLNEDTCLWEAPVAYPDDDKMYAWDEETTSWVETEGI